MERRNTLSRMTEETWKSVTIPGFEHLYQASDLGRIKSLDRKTIYPDGSVRFYKGKVLRTFLDYYGYPMVDLVAGARRERFKVHRLVALVFIANPEHKPQVNHKNGIRNDSRACNLEWCTQSENIKHSFRVLGRKAISKPGHENHRSRKILQFDKSGKLLKSWLCMNYALESLGKLGQGSITEVCQGKAKTAYGYIWKYVTDEGQNGK